MKTTVLSLILALQVLCSAAVPVTSESREAVAQEIIVTEYKQEESEDILWALLSKYSPNDFITAGTLAYFYRESQYKSDAVAGWGYEFSWKGTDRADRFVPMVDKGLSDSSTKDIFVEKAHGWGGYGLGQWWAFGYLDTFYDYVSENGTSIADADIQCAFVMWSMEQNEDLWPRLTKAKTADSAGWLIATLYDCTDDGADYISELAGVLYKRHCS